MKLVVIEGGQNKRVQRRAPTRITWEMVSQHQYWGPGGKAPGSSRVFKEKLLQLWYFCDYFSKIGLKYWGDRPLAPCFLRLCPLRIKFNILYFTLFHCRLSSFVFFHDINSDRFSRMFRKVYGFWQEFTDKFINFWKNSTRPFLFLNFLHNKPAFHNWHKTKRISHKTICLKTRLPTIRL